VKYYDQPGGTDKHYQVRAVGGGNLTAYYRDVGMRQVGSGTGGKPYEYTGRWTALSLVDLPFG
jgi:hypothetical protein